MRICLALKGLQRSDWALANRSSNNLLDALKFFIQLLQLIAFFVSETLPIKTAALSREQNKRVKQSKGTKSEWHCRL